MSKQTLGYIVVGLMTCGLLLGGFLYGTHYESLKQNKLFFTIFNVVTWGIVIWTALWWALRLIRKETRSETSEVPGKMVYSQSKMMIRYTKWLFLWFLFCIPAVLIALVTRPLF